ncbi:SOS response-associated peptidase [Pseudomonas panipatensis]|uniref:Abasic site processing protein n=1 Tax=Pseudomonas panipatensis TaxID=428992 RepID=A0A1G8CWE4_9PSED|nr:SOS response-associated peptidase family protein [Pseudomonas panipatensis]SDH49808.1 Putative SOS response-associated peptidase YedK [Pseudomonas panipatensis]SMP63272.1 Putative SOS response-associated peptidase YedK [Pseudomonas panipatensis]
MCGRVAQFDSWEELVRIMRWPGPAEEKQQAEPRYNVAPTTPTLLMVNDEGALIGERVRWGWRPHWVKDKPAPINARVEKVAHGPFFRAIWPHRAICPISGWYEWVDEGGPKKQPYFIRRRDGQACLTAAIGQFPAGDREASEHDGFVIITAGAQGGMVDVHDRRPVVLSPEFATEWMDTATPKERAEQIALIEGEPADAFEWYPVDKAVGNVRNQGPHLIEAIGHP